MQNPLEKLEFEKIVLSLSSFAKTELGRRKTLEAAFFLDPASLLKEQANMAEAMDIYARWGSLPLSNNSDVSKSIEISSKGCCLNEEECMRIASCIKTGNDIRRFFKNVDSSPLLIQYVKREYDLSPLENKIRKIIGDNLEVLDSASPKLRGIRAGKKSLEKEIARKVGTLISENRVYLSDATLNFKNGHYVLPVSTSNKAKVKGIIQDVSGSGSTTFIEPAAIVEMNNKMRELEVQEREEIHRILQELSFAIGEESESLTLENEMIGYLDSLEAKAKYAKENGCHIPDYSEEPLIEFYGARHPLLDREKAVANDFIMEKKCSLVLISGPNAGGKTVALKTVGLLVLMNQAGIPIPCLEASRVSFFKHVYVDIGDSQSISDNLSTFSGHMKNVAEILDLVGGKDLVLLDEIGTGTSPKEGEAIAYAVIQMLIKKHAFAFVSSHYEGLKAYALSSKSAQNACMLYDEERLLPTYKLKLGLPGESYGLEVAKRFGLQEEVVKSATSYLEEKEDFSVSNSIRKLSEATRRSEEEKRSYERKQRQLEAKEKELGKLEASLKLKDEKYHSSIEAEKEEILEEYREKLEEILDSVKSGEVKLHTVIAAKKRLEEQSEKEGEDLFDEELSIGDWVKMPGGLLEGKLVSLSGDKVLVQTDEGLSVKTDRHKLVKTIQPIKEKAKMRPTLKLDEVASSKSLPLELNLIGMRREEAENELMKYLDQAMIKGFKRVRIIHGYGTGALRNMVRDYLKKSESFVASFEAAGEYEGGGGATIVNLK